jgi:hypothetical protein
MIFKHRPTPFDGVIFAIVWRILSQHDFKVMFIRKFNHPFHKLRPMAGVVWAVVQVDD